MSDQNPTWMVNMPFDAVQQMKQDVNDARKKVVELEAKLAEAQIQAAGGGHSAVPRMLISGLRGALQVVQWAQGNYDPETVRGWPHAALREFIATIQAMPGASATEREWAVDAIMYADMAEAVERARKVGRQKELNQIPRSSIGKADYTNQVASILSSPPKEEGDDEPSQGGANEQPPEQTPPANA